MAEKIRLFKIASEINIGKETIVEYLQSKGFSIENKPTALLTGDMLDVVYDKFKKEKKAAEVQRDKLSKHKDIIVTPVKDFDDNPKTEDKSNSKVTTILEERLEAVKKTIEVAPKVSENTLKEIKVSSFQTSNQVDIENNSDSTNKDLTNKKSTEDNSNVSSGSTGLQSVGINVLGKIDLNANQKSNKKQNTDDKFATKNSKDNSKDSPKENQKDKPKSNLKQDTKKQDRPIDTTNLSEKLNARLSENQKSDNSSKKSNNQKKNQDNFNNSDKDNKFRDNRENENKVKSVDLKTEVNQNKSNIASNEIDKTNAKQDSNSDTKVTKLENQKDTTSKDDNRNVVVNETKSSNTDSNETNSNEPKLNEISISSKKVEVSKEQKTTDKTSETKSEDLNNKTEDAVSKDNSAENSTEEPKKKKKRKKIVEVDPFDKVELKGLTIVGKIDLNAGKPKNNRDSREPRDRRDFRDRGDFRNRSTQSTDPRDANRDNRGFRDDRDNRPARDNDNRDNRPPRDANRDNRDFRDRRDSRDRQPQDKGNLTVGKKDSNTGRSHETGKPGEKGRFGGNDRPNDRRQSPNPRNNQGRPGDRPNDRPGDNRSYNDRGPRDNRPGDNRPGDNRGGDRFANRPFGDRPFDRSFGDRPPRDRGASLPFENANFGGASRPSAPGAPSKVKVKEFSDDKPKSQLDLKKKKKKKGIRESISSVDIDRAIKETLAGMDDTGASSRAKIKQKKKLEREEKEQKLQEEQLIESKRLQLTEFVTTSDLAALINTTPSDIIMRCMKLGLMVTINQRLDKDTISLLADDFGFEVIFVEDTLDTVLEDIEENEEDLKERPAIVTIMGHVDHGKTSLLDYIRKTRVTQGEAGGITQHIGAYKVNLHEKSITFLDTPGHEAFTAMRARGAQITDIVILVVAADDMVMPQTIEAISHAKAANVPIIVAINKIDKAEANPDKIRQQLSEHDVLVEEWGGKYQCVELSAKQGINVDTLLEKILLEAELMELKANPDRKARGAIIEANMDKGLGATATVVVQKGTLKVGDPFVSGISSGKVRGMFDERGQKVEVAYPSQPVKVIGFDLLPSAGDTFISVNNEPEARKIANDRKILKREQELRQFRHVTLEDFSSKAGFGEVKDLHLIIKADVDGSAEALGDSLMKLTTSEVRLNILHKAVGPINESDVMLAVASGAIIVGFHISATPKAQKLADDEKVEIRNYDIIYDCISDIKNAMEGLLTPDVVEEITGNVEVRALFKNSKVGNIAGCYVLDGRITRNDKVKVLRDGLVIHTGTLQSLKREKDDVKEVETSFECGVLVRDFNDIKVNDIIQPYKLVEVKRKLK